MKPIERRLNVFFYDDYVGQLLQVQGGDLGFEYDEAYIEREGLAISFALPVQKKRLEGKAVKAFFSGILPDEGERERLARQVGVSQKNPFALLNAIGGECAGAISIHPIEETACVDKSKSPLYALPLDEKAVLDLLKRLEQRPLLAGENGLRLSLAGAQQKLAIVYKNGQIHLSQGDAPTTHILKPPLQRLEDSCLNELFCMRLAHAMGFETPHTFLYWAEETPCYLVERYDRIHRKDGSIQRLHQEDFCQALAIVPEQKYESEGGPSIHACLTLLDNASMHPAKDKMSFTDRLIFNYLIGNTDAHGKNFSLLYDKEKARLAPMYDLLSLAIYPAFDAHMAMHIGGRKNPDELLLRHWHTLVPNTKVAQRHLEKRLLKLAKETPEKAEALKERLKQEGVQSNIFERIIALIQERSQRLRGLCEA